MTDLHPQVAAQLAELAIQAGRPLVVSDADEVLFAFMASFERYLNRRGLIFDWSSFALTGNVRERGSNAALPAPAVRDHLAAFFENHTEDIAPVAGAREALAELGRAAQIVVLSNLPLAQRAARQRALSHHGMDFPLIANIGLKGPAVRALSDRARAPAVFIDDIPHNHSSVAAAAGAVWRLHMVADPRLARLLDRAPDSHARIDTWPEAAPVLAARLGIAGAAPV